MSIYIDNILNSFFFAVQRVFVGILIQNYSQGEKLHCKPETRKKKSSG